MWMVLLFGGCSDPCGESGDICTIAGTGEASFGDAGLDARDSALYWPSDVTVAPDGQPWVVDWNNHRILRLEGDVEQGYVTEVITGGGYTGDGPLDGPLSTAHWNHPTGIAFRDDGVAIMAAWHNSRVVGLDAEQDTIEHLAGTGWRAFDGDGGPAVDATFDLPSSTAYGDDGRLYVSDQANQRIRCIEPDGTIVTVVGSGVRDYTGDGGPALEATLEAEVSQNADPGGRITIHEGRLYIADTLNNAIRVVDMDTWIITSLVGRPGPDTIDAQPRLSWPRDVAMGPDGWLYVADSENHCIRRFRDGEQETVAGVCTQPGFDGDGGPATEALLYRPLGIDVAPDGGVLIADTYNNVVRYIRP